MLNDVNVMCMVVFYASNLSFKAPFALKIWDSEIPHAMKTEENENASFLSDYRHIIVPGERK